MSLKDLLVLCQTCSSSSNLETQKLVNAFERGLGLDLSFAERYSKQDILKIVDRKFGAVKDFINLETTGILDYFAPILCDLRYEINGPLCATCGPMRVLLNFITNVNNSDVPIRVFRDLLMLLVFNKYVSLSIFILLCKIT